jgi:hypothetical protein
MEEPGSRVFRFPSDFWPGWPKIAGNPKTWLPDSGMLAGVVPN